MEKRVIRRVQNICGRHKPRQTIKKARFLNNFTDSFKFSLVSKYVYLVVVGGPGIEGVCLLYFLVWPRQAKLVLSPNSLVEIRQMAAFFGKEDFPTIMQPP